MAASRADGWPHGGYAVAILGVKAGMILFPEKVTNPMGHPENDLALRVRQNFVHER